MKAYQAWNTTEPYYSTIVFAENISEAKKIAFRSDVFDGLWDLKWTDIRVKRNKSFDNAYHGNAEMDFDDPIDRRIFCEHGWECSDEMFTPYLCKGCTGKDICSRYEEYLYEERKEERMLDWLIQS